MRDYIALKYGWHRTRCRRWKVFLIASRGLSEIDEVDSSLKARRMTATPDNEQAGTYRLQLTKSIDDSCPGYSMPLSSQKLPHSIYGRFRSVLLPGRKVIQD